MPQPPLFARIRQVLLYYVPAITSPLIGYLLRLSPTSSVWDFCTAFKVCIVRAIFNDPTPKSMVEEQQASLDDLPVPDTMWMVETVLPAPGDNNLGEGVSKAIVEFGHGADEVSRIVVEPVKGEWVAIAALPKPCKRRGRTRA